MPSDVETHTVRPRETHIVKPYNERDTPMGELKFDRDKAGIKAIAGWDDADYYNGVGKGIDACTGDVVKIAASLPTDTIGAGCKTDNNGTRALKKTLDWTIKLFAGAAREIADGCATLGSGIKSGIENFDSQKNNSATRFDMLQSSLPKK